MQASHTWRKCRLTLLLPLLAATEFVENSAFTFAASQINHGLHATPLEFSLLLAAFTTGTMLMIALQQVLTRHWGYRRYLMLALGFFLGGALGSALSTRWGELILFRTLEGLGSGALFTSSRILVVHLFSGEERLFALRMYIAGLFGMTATGPILAAMLSQHGGWQYSFLTPVPFAGLAIIGIYLWMPHGVGLHEKPVRWSATPILVFTGAVFLVQLSLAAIRMVSRPLLQPGLLIAMIGGAMLWHLMARQRYHKEPFIRWQELRQPSYMTGLLLYSLYYLIANANNYLFPILTEHVMALPVQTVGWLSSFSASITWVTALLYLRWARQVPQKQWLMAGSCLLLLLSCLWLATAHETSTVPYLIPALVGKGMFGALLVLPLAGFTFRYLSDDHFGSGYQNKNLIRQLAISIGTAACSLATSGLQDSYKLSSAGATSQEAWRWAVSNVYLLLAAASCCMLVMLLAQKKLR